ncbi:hypothetical protein [Mitsuaria sp. 7]|uniref:hypothetical protein n=1 Tax=Mitsuaria sp. 7 TaxID=1658665 RepID=UPI0007DD7B05|nr:hypothetical protein [Mitsuaria sp. 7]ANH67740.1 hypothetical protein ABE85_09415 [Mitsuaria sp. 7]
MTRLLTQQVTDIAGYLKTVRGKKARAELKKFTSQMLAGDQLWEYAWSATVGLRDCHESGWCIVRDQQVVARHCAYFS